MIFLRLIAAVTTVFAPMTTLAQAKTVLGKLGQTTAATRIYAAPNTKSRVYYRAKPYEYVVLRPYKNATWYKVLLQNGSEGYIVSEKVAQLPYDVTAPTEQPTRVASRNSPRGGGAPTLPSRSGAGSTVVNYGLQYKGTPYVWGGNDLNNGIDCSGFVKGLFGKIGVSLPRTAAEQAMVGKPITRLEDLQPGDRLYFWSSKRNKIGHTGIYMGNGYFIHSSTNNRGVATDYLGTQKWLSILVAARR